MADFEWPVDWGAAAETTPRVLIAKFGNGYEQRAADGLNWQPRAWDVSFENRDTSTADDIVEFFTLMGGVTSFTWAPPRGTTGKWVCRKWSTSEPNYGSVTIRARFEEVFE